MTDYNAHKIPIVEGINDIPLEPNAGDSGQGCNGAYYIDKYHDALDAIAADINSKFDIPTGTTAEYVRGDGSVATLPSSTPTVVAAGSNISVDNVGDTYTVSTHAANLIQNGNSKVEVSNSNGPITIQVSNLNCGNITTERVSLGLNAGNSDTNHTNNISLGIGANTYSNYTTLDSTVLGSGIASTNQVSIGSQANQASFAVGNIAIGTNSNNATLYGGFNTVLGYQARCGNLTDIALYAGQVGPTSVEVMGSENVVIGAYAGYYADVEEYGPNNAGTQSKSVIIGARASEYRYRNMECVHLGYKSFFQNDNNTIDATLCTSLGAYSLISNTLGVLTNLTTIGAYAGSVSGINNCTQLGYNAQASSSTVSNEITLGNNAITSLRCNVTSITSLSDQRDKTNIQPLPLGLNFINSLNPVTFQWDKREWYESGISDGTKKEETLNAGFIAQDLQQAQQDFNADYLKLVYDSNPDKLEATPGNLLFVAIKAIQELSTELTEVKAQLALLQGAA